LNNYEQKGTIFVLQEKNSRMLIRFVVSNFLSFKEETEFNMLTGSFKIHQDHVYERHGVEVLKAAAIYGANGAGKSNLIKAISFFKDIIDRGTLRELPPKHKASPEMLSIPSSFEIEFMTVSSSYSYKLIIDGGKILSEALLKTSATKGDEMIFERSVDFMNQQKLELHPRYLESDEDKLRKKLLEDEFIVFNKPFLSIAARLKDNKVREIGEAYEWITKKVIIIFPQTKPDYILQSFIFSKKFHQFSNQMMCGFDTGIIKVDVETLTLDEYYGKDNLRESKLTADKLTTFPFLEVASEAVAVLNDNKPVIKKLYTHHRGDGDEPIKFELAEESEGTQRLFNFIPAFYLLLFQNAAVFFDEIDQSIHSYLLKTLLEKVMSEKNTTGQIIFTTHESNLLDLEIFRQDEIWFASKNSRGATTFYSLSEYKPRYDLDIRKGYLNGRFGAIPNTGDLTNSNWTDYAEKKQGV
jgi:AAA15 family ATPase/GTPase